MSFTSCINDIQPFQLILVVLCILYDTIGDIYGFETTSRSGMRPRLFDTRWIFIILSMQLSLVTGSCQYERKFSLIEWLFFNKFCCHMPTLFIATNSCNGIFHVFFVPTLSCSFENIWRNFWELNYSSITFSFTISFHWKSMKNPYQLWNTHTEILNTF